MESNISQVSSATEVTNSDFKSMDWSSKIKETKNLKMWFKASSSWITKNSKDLTDLLKRGGNITMVVPNYENEKLMNDLVFYHAPYYNIVGPEESIKKSIQLLLNCVPKDDCTGKVEIYLHRGMIFWPAYLFDTNYVMGIHEHSKWNTITSPVFVASPASKENLEWFNAQFEILKSDSKPYALNTSNNNNCLKNLATKHQEKEAEIFEQQGLVYERELYYEQACLSYQKAADLYDANGSLGFDFFFVDKCFLVLQYCVS